MAIRISSGNVTQSLVERIGAAIVRGDYVIGRSLPTEAALSEEYGVSRTVTREAIKMLTAKGLVLSWPRRGTIVQEESNWNLLDVNVLAWLLDRDESIPLVLDFLHLRLAIEPAAAEAAAAKDADVSEIEAALNQMKHVEKHGGSTLTADSEFHAAILRASNNVFFEQMAPMVDTALRMSIRITDRIKGVKVAGIQEHADLFEAIRSNNPKMSRRLSHLHVERAVNCVAEYGEKARRLSR